MDGQNTLPLYGENFSAMNQTNRKSAESTTSFFSSNDEVEKNNMSLNIWRNLWYNSSLWTVFTGVSGKGLMIQQNPVYVNMFSDPIM